MKYCDIRTAIEKGCVEINRLHARVRETVRLRDSGPQQCEE